MTPERVVEADAILREWQAEYDQRWQAAGEDWFRDPHWEAYFDLAQEFWTAADAVVARLPVGAARGYLGRLVDKYMVG